MVSSSLPTDPSLHSLTGELSDVMENSVLSLHPNNSSHDADSEGEEPREEIVLPPPAAAKFGCPEIWSIVPLVINLPAFRHFSDIWSSG